jgi:hypothetical protein
VNDTATAIISQLIIVAVIALRFLLDWDGEVRHERGGCNHDNPPHAKFCRRCGVSRGPGRPRP